MDSIFDSDEFNRNLFFPRLDYSKTPNGAEDFFISVESSCKIHVRTFRSLTAKFSILFFHGNGEIISDYNSIAESFMQLGCDFTVCDYRGYGKSEGIPSLKTTLNDASAIYCFLKKNDILNKKVCVMGRSIGSAPALDLCKYFSEITCCVIESGYADPIPLVKRRGLKISSITREENALYNNSEKIRLIKCPIFIMHGEVDTLISPEEAKLNYKNVSSQIKILKILKGVGHNDMLMAPNNSYFNSLSSFFAQVVL